MTIEELYQAIELPYGAQTVIRDIKIESMKEDSLYRLFYKDRSAFYKELEKEPDRALLGLKLFSRFAVTTYELYEEKGIDKQIFVDTFRDLSIWCKDYYRKNGVYGLEELEWLSTSIDMRLFRLGRLQFEPIILEQKVLLEDEVLLKGTSVLNIHIPEGEPLSPLQCQRSLEMAKKFFLDKYKYAICMSWLLSPLLDDILEDTSNIKQFKQRFYIYNVTYEFPQIEQRVFGCIAKEKEKYPEESSLQRKVKEQILKGVDFGMGHGICRIE